MRFLPNRGLARLWAFITLLSLATAHAATIGVTVGTDGKLHDVNGKVLRLTGVNASGMESAIGHCNNGAKGACPDDWTGTTPDWTAIASAGFNAVRIPLNEISWLGTKCTWTDYNTGAVTLRWNPDPLGTYHQTLDTAVADATAAGLYVILDLHWSAPGAYCAETQNPMPDTDHSVTFWQQVATRYKTYPNVIFDVFNEPYVFPTTVGNDGLFVACARAGQANCVATTGTQDLDGIDTGFDECLTNGCTARYLRSGKNGGNTNTLNTWTTAGEQSLINAIRGTGATNVIMVSGNGRAYRIYTIWNVSWQPTDPLKQLAVSSHTYSSATHNPAGGDYFHGGGNVTAAMWSSFNVPLIMGETGENSDCEPQQPQCSGADPTDPELEWDRWFAGDDGTSGYYPAQPGVLAIADSMCMNTFWWSAMSDGGYPGPIFDTPDWTWDVYSKYLKTWNTLINHVNGC